MNAILNKMNAESLSQHQGHYGSWSASKIERNYHLEISKLHIASLISYFQPECKATWLLSTCKKKNVSK